MLDVVYVGCTCPRSNTGMGGVTHLRGCPHFVDMTACAAAGGMPTGQTFATCDKCGSFHTTAQCFAFPSTRLSDEDVDRIARRVVALLEGR